MSESAASRTRVPDEAPPLPPLGLRVAARDEMEAERAPPVEVAPPPVGGRERRAASSASTRVRSSRGGAIFGERSGGRGIETVAAVRTGNSETACCAYD
jgi:hypothetical protein